MHWIVAMDNDSFVSEYYGTGYIPTMYIINQTGYVHYKEIGFDQTEVIKSLKLLIDPEATSPEFIGELSIIAGSSVLDFYSREITITCQNVTDNFVVKSVYLEITSSSTILESKKYILTQFDNGSIKETIEVDARQLYNINSIDVSLIAEDYAGNI
ncbi:MAG: TlpA family protein disulfide reductase, partial [Candidatus Hodarchaeales archaeon]